MATMHYGQGYYRPYSSTLEMSNGPMKDGEYPDMNAMDNILPEYQYIFKPGDGDPQGPADRKGRARTPYEMDDLEKSSLTLLESQNNEMQNYREALKKMAQDVMTLQGNVRDLEANNGKLRQNLATYTDANRLMADSAELDNLPKQEVMQRYGSMKQCLSDQTTQLKDYKVKLQKVQNELIKKNDSEKEYLKMQKAHSTQQQMIQRLQDKLKKMKVLETACKKQEDVIVKMEKVLEKLNRERSKFPKDKAMQEANDALLQENKRLRVENEELRSHMRGAGNSQRDDMERMEQFQALDRAEARIAALEKQLAENSRQWGKERADMSLRLNEREHGFGMSNALVLHSFKPFEEDSAPRKSYRRLSPVYP